MRYTETRLLGAYVIEPELSADERGFFARTWCQKEFSERGLNPRVVQCSVSFNHWRGTLRGMHWQRPPYQEAKLVRCIRGAVHDVIIDLREGSATRCQWFGVELSEANRRSLYVPEGFAHGFVTLEDRTEVFYQISEFHHSQAATGVRWDDPAFGIQWPVEVRIVSEKDRSYPDWEGGRA